MSGLTAEREKDSISSTELENQKVHGVQVIALNKINNKLLLGRRGNGKVGAGEWALIGGTLEGGEDQFTRMSTELAEEAGISTTRDELHLLFEIDTYIDGRNHHRQGVFLLVTDYQVDEPNDLSNEEFAYFDFNDLPENMFEPSRAIIYKYLELYA